MKFIVKREHYGDRMYVAGETREAVKADVQHLIEKGILVEAGSDDVSVKKEPEPKNKAVKRAPKNKAQ